MKFIKHRRGLSNVVTTAIMLTSVAVMGSGLVVWSHGNLSAFQEGLANTTSTTTNKINENLIIENIEFCKLCSFGWLGSSNSIINVTLTNTGTLALNVTQIKINNTITIPRYASPTVPGQITSAASIRILPQQSYTVSAVLPSPPSVVTQMKWCAKCPSTITVTTARGLIFTTQAVAP